MDKRQAYDEGRDIKVKKGRRDEDDSSDEEVGQHGLKCFVVLIYILFFRMKSTRLLFVRKLNVSSILRDITSGLLVCLCCSSSCCKDD